MSAAVAEVAEPDALPMADEIPATTTVRVHVDILDMARVVCAHTKGRNGRNLKLTDYLDVKLRGPITKDYKDILRKVARDQGERG